MDQHLPEISPEPVLIEDYTATAHGWAQDVEIVSFELVGGSYVAYHIVLITRAGSRVSIYKRYSEFCKLREALVLAKPLEYIPEIPPKAVFSKFDRGFLEKRRKGLDYFLKCIALNHKTSETKMVRNFFV